jgi:hypothetical protein
MKWHIVNVVTFDSVVMIYYLLHLHKTHVSNNKKQEQWKETWNKSKKRKLCYAMLYYVQLKFKEIDVSPN